ncbi:MAG: D-amino-acid dehydrogenase, partial [Bacteroidia bacterium]
MLINIGNPTGESLMNATMTDTVGIVGGGIIGVASALNLARKGIKTTIIDPQIAGRAASYGNAGGLNPSSVVPVNIPGLVGKTPGMLLKTDSPLFLRWSYLPRLLPWMISYLSHCRHSEALRIGQGLEVLLKGCPGEHQALAHGTAAANFLKGSELLVVYDDIASFEADAYAWSLRQQHGIEWDTIGGEALRELEPALSNDSFFAVRLARHGFVTDPGQYVAALTDAFEELGGTVIRDEVIDFGFEDKGAKVMLQSGKSVDFSKLVIAAGAWSGRLCNKLGLSVPLESERGYHVEYIEPSSMPTRPMMFAGGKFVATPMDGRLRCAGLVEFGGLDMPPAKPPIEFLKRQVKAIFPQLRYERIETWQGHRPALTDSLPVIGKLPNRRNVILAFGHHHVGLAAGARTGRIVADL